jgi:tRNA (guanine-N7-)-methyltransferase
MTPDDKKDFGPRFYGRRKGKPMRGGKLDALESVLPGIEVRLTKENSRFSLSRSAGEGTRGSYTKNSSSRFMPPSSLFPSSIKEIRLEIGFGDGEHLLHQAMHTPDSGFIGCEPFVNGVAALCAGIKKNGVKNIRIFPDDARLLMAALEDHCISVCWILNSDPWPKKRHHKRRFIQKETLDELHRILKPGGKLVMSSDHPGLSAWQLEKTLNHGGFEWTAREAADWRDRPADMPETRYQKKNMAGHPVTYLIFRAKDQ